MAVYDEAAIAPKMLPAAAIRSLAGEADSARGAAGVGDTRSIVLL